MRIPQARWTGFDAHLSSGAPDAPLLHDDMMTEGVDPKPDAASNVSKRVEFALGDVEKGFAEADVIVEREFNTKPVHQGYIEPHACVASMSEDGQADLAIERLREACAAAR